jgi:hypothetical protein
MREHEASRSSRPWRWHPWFKRVTSAAAHVSAATLLAAGVANSLAARKHESRDAPRGRRDHANTDGDRGNGRNRGDNSGNDPKADRGLQRDHSHRQDADGNSANHDRGVKHQHHVDTSNDVHSAANKTPTPTPTSTPPPESGGGGGGGGGRGHGGGTNAGSGVFDNPLATKAHRRAKDFDHTNQDQAHDGTVVDVHPDGDSVYQTHSVSLTTGPDGLEIVTNNITYTAEATPTPEPLPGLELPAHDPGFPFGNDFPFGNATVAIGPAAPETSDPGDTGMATDSRAKPISSLPDLGNSDGGDNSMDFTS